MITGKRQPGVWGSLGSTSQLLIAPTAGLKRVANERAAWTATSRACGSLVIRYCRPKLSKIMKPRSWVSVRVFCDSSPAVQRSARLRQAGSPVCSSINQRLPAKKPLVQLSASASCQRPSGPVLRG